jgi:signal transduction histidine kinase
LRAPFARLVIRDTGSGIAPELLPVIFDPFRQGACRVAPADLGIGLGLALARELVRLHHGRIEARSAGEGRGSTFIVCLPLADTRAGGSHRRPSRLNGNGRRVFR